MIPLIGKRFPRSGSLILLAPLLLSACGSGERPVPDDVDLFGEYVRATNVKNDRIPTASTSADRLANIAAHYTPEVLKSQLFSAFPCTENSAARDGLFDTSCDLNDEVLAAVQSAGGDLNEIHGRVVIVKHEDGSFELLTLFVANGKLIDSTGQTYTGLDDFRENNELLDADDLIMAPRNITAVPGEGELVTDWGRK